MAKTYNIFISHSWSYGSDFDNLKKLLREKPYFVFRDYSVPKDDPIHDAPTSPKLYKAIASQMRSCHVVLILAGKYATFSTWINNEITIANEEFSLPKPIVGIAPKGAQQTSTVVQENANRLVRWNSNSIVTAIREVAI